MVSTIAQQFPNNIIPTQTEYEMNTTTPCALESFINKLVFLLPAGLLLAEFAPWMIPPLLMLGGAYLCYEGAEKLAHALGAGKGHGGPDGSHMTGDPAQVWARQTPPHHLGTGDRRR